jgi:hypothetical protein
VCLSVLWSQLLYPWDFNSRVAFEMTVNRQVRQAKCRGVPVTVQHHHHHHHHHHHLDGYGRLRDDRQETASDRRSCRGRVGVLIVVLLLLMMMMMRRRRRMMMMTMMLLPPTAGPAVRRLDVLGLSEPQSAGGQPGRDHAGLLRLFVERDQPLPGPRRCVTEPLRIRYETVTDEVTPWGPCHLERSHGTPHAAWLRVDLFFASWSHADNIRHSPGGAA